MNDPDEGINPPPRVLGVGIPQRLHTDFLANLSGAVLASSSEHAAAVLTAHPGVAVVYGEDTFGPAVAGQPVFLLPEQHERSIVPRVIILVDVEPTAEAMEGLSWDDPRRLVVHAGVRLNAGHLADVSPPGTWLALDVLLDELLAQPPL